MYHYIKSLLLALSLLSVVAVAIGSPDGGFVFSQATYDGLNSYLVTNKLTDPGKAILKLEKLLHEEMERGKSPLVFNGLKVKALQQLILLANIANSQHPYCNAEALKVIKQNEYSIKAVDQTSLSNLIYEARVLDVEPIQRLVLFFIIKHATYCQNVYPELMKTKLSSMNQTNVNLVEKLFNGVVDLRYTLEKGYRMIQTDSQAMYGALIKYPHKITKKDAPLLLEALKEVSKDDPDNKYLYANEEELLKDLKKEHKHGGNILLKKYLLKPCSYYVEELQSIVESTQHDFKIGMGLSDSKMDFYHSIALYGICTNIVHP